MSVAMVLGLALGVAAPQQRTPESLLYLEIYACSVIAGEEHAKMHEGGTSPVTTSERARADAFLQLQRRANAALPAAQAREHIEDRNIPTEQGAARELLGMVSADQRREVTDMCLSTFGVS